MDTTNLDKISWDSTFIEVAVFVPVCVERSHPPTNSHHVLRSFLDAKKSDLIIHCLRTKIWGQISWGDSALETSPGVVFLPGDSLLHLGRSKLSEVLFQSRHEVQLSGVKTCVVERSFKSSDEVLYLVAIQVNLHKLCHHLNIHHIKVVLLGHVRLFATKFVRILGNMSKNYLSKL